MKPFTSASLAEVGVFAIRQTLRRIIREFEDDPNTAVRQTIDAETKKKAIDVDVIADREFATQFRHYDGGRYAPVIVGEERPGEAVPVIGTFGTYVLVDASDGSDLAERSLANWCSGAVFFEVAGSTAKIRAAVVGMPPNHVYFATDDDPRVRVYRNLPDLEGQILANLALEPDEVTGLPPERALSAGRRCRIRAERTEALRRRSWALLRSQAGCDRPRFVASPPNAYRHRGS